MTTETKVNEQARNQFMAYDACTQTITIMRVCQAYVIIGVVLSALVTFVLSLCCFDGLRNKFRNKFWIDMGTLRIVVTVTPWFILVSSFGASWSFVFGRIVAPFASDVFGLGGGITGAFKSDKGSICNYGISLTMPICRP